MKLFFVTLSLVFVSLFAQAQTKAEAKVKAKTAATKMGKALMDKDYDGFVRSTYPKAVNEADGGLKKLADNLREQVKAMESQDNKILSVWPEEPSNIIDTAGEWQCTITQKITMGIQQGKLTTETTLIGLSPNKGTTWYFIDMAESNLAEMRMIFPNISSKLLVPQPVEPVFEVGK